MPFVKHGILKGLPIVSRSKLKFRDFKYVSMVSTIAILVIASTVTAISMLSQGGVGLSAVSVGLKVSFFVSVVLTSLSCVLLSLDVLSKSVKTDYKHSEKRALLSLKAFVMIALLAFFISGILLINLNISSVALKQDIAVIVGASFVSSAGLTSSYIAFKVAHCIRSYQKRDDLKAFTPVLRLIGMVFDSSNKANVEDIKFEIDKESSENPFDFEDENDVSVKDDGVEDGMMWKDLRDFSIKDVSVKDDCVDEDEDGMVRKDCDGFSIKGDKDVSVKDDGEDGVMSKDGKSSSIKGDSEVEQDTNSVKKEGLVEGGKAKSDNNSAHIEIKEEWLDELFPKNKIKLEHEGSEKDKITSNSNSKDSTTVKRLDLSIKQSDYKEKRLTLQDVGGRFPKTIKEYLEWLEGDSRGCAFSREVCFSIFTTNKEERLECDQDVLRLALHHMIPSCLLCQVEGTVIFKNDFFAFVKQNHKQFLKLKDSFQQVLLYYGIVFDKAGFHLINKKLTTISFPGYLEALKHALLFLGYFGSKKDIVRLMNLVSKNATKEEKALLKQVKEGLLPIKDVAEKTKESFKSNK